MKKYIRIIIPVMIFVAVEAFILFLPDVSPSDDIPQSDVFNCEEGIHNYTVENKCALCGDIWEYTEGLKFENYENGVMVRGFKEESTVTNIVIPYGYEGKPVVFVGAGWKDEIVSMVIPESVYLIDSEAFAGCRMLKNVTLPKNLKTIGWRAFVDTALYADDSNWVDGVLYIGNSLIAANTTVAKKYTVKEGTTCIASGAFFRNGSIESIKLPKSLKAIDDIAFEYCVNLKSVTVGGNIEYVGASVFRETKFISDAKNWENDALYIGKCLIRVKNTAQGTFVVKEGTKAIAERAFYGCTQLKEVRLPDTLKELPTQLFSDCSALEKIDIPQSVTHIGAATFSGSGIKVISIPANVIYIGTKCFYKCENLSEAVFEDTAGWKTAKYTNEIIDLREILTDPNSAALALKNGDYKQWTKNN